MSKVLLEAILDDGIRKPKFFNGRLLSGEDLSAEQLANSEARERLGRAVGDGIAMGFEVSDPGVGNAATPIVWVEPGLAISRKGQVLRLSTRVELSLGSAPAAANGGDATPSAFSECKPLEAGAYVAGAGVYLLVVCPASATQGRALVSGLGNELARCNVGFTVEGVTFRVVQVKVDAPHLADVARLRNRIAYRSFGAEALEQVAEQPFGPELESYGLIDELRSGGLVTDCDVPLAVFFWTANAGIEFLDLWSVRRRVVDPKLMRRWSPVISDRRLGEAEAAFLQFQAEVLALRLRANASTLKAHERFLFLPPAGYLPVGKDAFDWKTFLGALAPPSETLVDDGLLRAIVHESLFQGPIVVDPIEVAMSPGKAPPTPVAVYRVPGHDGFVVFARSRLGRIRVFLEPAPGAGGRADVRAVSKTGNAEIAAGRIAAGPFIIANVAPGDHSVHVAVEGFVEPRPADATAVAGRTTDLVVPVEPLPNGRIVVSVVDQAEDAIGSKVSSVSAAPATGGATLTAHLLANGQWQFDDVPEDTYRVTVAAPNYVSRTLADVRVPRGKVVPLRIVLDRAVRTPPAKCVEVRDLTHPPLQKVLICIVSWKASKFLPGIRESAFEFTRQGAVLPATPEPEPDPHEKLTLKTSQIELETKKARTFLFAERATVRFEDEGTVRNDLQGRASIPLDRQIEFERPWSLMGLLEPADVVKGWLNEWKAFLSEEFPGGVDQRKEPVIYVDPGWSPPRIALQVPSHPYAYAVFGRLYVPVSIVPSEHRTFPPVLIDKVEIPGLAGWQVDRLKNFGIYYVDQLPGLWGTILDDMLGQPGIGPDLVADAATVAKDINEKRLFREGVPLGVSEVLKSHGLHENVALANADRTDPKLLTDIATALEKAGKPPETASGLMNRLVLQAREMLPREAWTLDSLGFGSGEIAALGREGITSKGELLARASKAADVKALEERTGISEESLTAVQPAIIADLTAHALEHAPAAELTGVPGVNAVVANKLAEAGFTSVESVSTARAPELALKTGLSEAQAKSIIAGAASSARGSMKVDLIAAMTGASKKLANMTLSQVGKSTESKLAPMFGGDSTKAKAFLDVVKTKLGGIP